MAFTERFDHVAIGVHDAEVAARVFRDLLGGELVGGGDVPEEGFRFIQYRYPNRMKLELIEPLGKAGFLRTFLERRGEGTHHLTFRVTGIESKIELLR